MDETENDILDDEIIATGNSEADMQKIEMIKEKLESTKNQNERRALFSQYTRPKSEEAAARFDALTEKLNQKVPIFEKFVKIYTWSLPIAILCSIIVFATNSMKLGVCLIEWGLFGIPEWIILKALVSINRKKPEHYLNLKNI